MRRKSGFLRNVSFSLLCAACVFLLSPDLRTAAEGSCETAGYCFVTPAGAGAKTGVDWNNAYADLPNNLTRGVMYFLAGSATTYANHVFKDSDSGTTPIYIYKAVDCSVVPSAPYCGTVNPAAVAGWQASFGTNAAEWLQTPNSDPETYTGSVSDWRLCSDYYTFDGVTGSVAPTAPGGQGFVVGGQNNTLEGLIALSSNGAGCNSAANLTNISFLHMEVKGTGPMPYYPVAVTGCSYDGANATISLTSSLNGVTGDAIGGWTSASAVLFTNVVSSSMTSSQVVIPLASSPCSTLAYVGLDFGSSDGIQGTNHANVSEMITNVTVEYCYIHDLGETIGDFYNSYNTQVLHNYLARNRSTPTEHSSIVQFDESSSSTVDGPVTVAYNFILDGNGTAWITHLGEPARCRLNCGTISGYYVYGNIFTCHKGAAPYQCGTGHGMVSDNAGENVVKNAVFTNNTIAGPIGPAGVWLLNPNSTGTIENNFFYNNGNEVRMQVNGGGTHDYNTLLNSSVVYGTICDVSETCITSGASDPFANDSTFDFHLVADMNSPAKSRKPAAQGKFLPAPFNIDFDGKPRGADGTWERGAYEFKQGPQPPTNLKAKVH